MLNQGLGSDTPWGQDQTQRTLMVSLKGPRDTGRPHPPQASALNLSGSKHLSGEP